MPGLEFSMPYNGDLRTLDQLLAIQGRNGNRVREVYLGVPQQIAGSGRAGSDAVTTMEDFLAVVDRIHAAGIRVDLTMNSTCAGSEWYEDDEVRKVCDFVRTMHDTHGVEAVTLANPFYISRVHEACPDIEISASVLCDVDCFSRAKVVADAGARVVTVDTAINRDLKLLGQIHRRLGLEIKLMVNEGCLYKCPYRKFHMNYISHRSQEAHAEGNAFSFACGDIILKDPAEIFRSNWVRPEDMEHYAKAGVTTFFKLVGRDMLASKVLRAARAYMDQSYDGNLLDLLCSSVGFYDVEHSAFVDNKALGASGFFKRLSTCNRKCYDCDYCTELVDRFVRYGWVTEENLRDMGQNTLADSIKARFGGQYPRCPEMTKEPKKTGAELSQATFATS